MTLSEIHQERLQTRLKTKRWHELNQMERDRVAKINADHGHEANPDHNQGYHRHQRIQAEIRQAKDGRLVTAIRKRMGTDKLAHHKKLEEAFRKEDYRTYVG